MNDALMSAGEAMAETHLSLATTDVVQAPAAEVAEVAAEAEVPAGPNGFELLGLAPELVQAVADMGYTEPTQVQNKAIPLALNTGGGVYADLMVSSQTGSGKTAAFLLPMLHTLLTMQQEAAAAEKAAHEQACAEAEAKGEPAPKRAKRKDPTNPRNFKPATPGALVVCPTRELAQQVANDGIDLVRHCRGLRIANVVGGMPYQLQVAKLQNADLVVATPGRLLDLQRSGQIKLDEVKFLVMDEADRMLDLGFADDLAEINQLTLQRRQTMMFSATFAPRIQQLALRVMHDNGANVKKIQIDTPQEKHANITQSLFWADNPEHKRALLDHWLRDTTINQAIVFASTQIECDNLANDLQQTGFSAVALHGALSQGMRNRRLMALRDGRVQILVATDVAARGIDVPTITHVFNFGLPMKAEDYTHRIGRTGRAGRDGLAVTFAEFRDRRKIADIEYHTHQPLKAEVIPGLEPKQRPPQASFGGRGGEGRGGFGGAGGGRGRPAPRREGGFGGGNGGGFGGFGRADKGGFDRGNDRGPRPEFRAERPAWGNDRPAGAPRFEGRSERPAFSNDRPSFGDRPAFNHDRSGFGGDKRGPARSFDREGGRGFEGRPERSFEPRGERAAPWGGGADRAPHGAPRGGDFKPRRPAGADARFSTDGSRRRTSVR
ncbi:MAG: DEAD/DEAH box helicase [Polaromonas sp.]|nr:DEAD/DEAH box helicase [Polaromonas sp.]